ncbi:MAG: TonB-dependent receptor [Robiginitomaculum sp.]|nr:MAG: TonB-dependent receptor [Robiginitomaculum sp.]
MTIRKFLTGVSVIAVASASLAASAQTSDEEEPANTDEIVVTGFKQSLKKAQDLKYSADTFVDAITAEDIGALPDRSVAEALQRLPGVNISRFAQADDPDRFSVEGSGVVVRGLPFVRSELNGRGIFSANGGRALSFNDVSPELLGAVEVFKNTTADMIDGGISGTVNLVTRKPLDRPGLHLAGTVGVNIGDLAGEVSPAFSVLGSNTWETKVGTFGIQLGYTQSELVSRTDASQVTDPCYRADTLDGACFRLDGIAAASGSTFDETNFPPANSVVVPKGAGVRTTTFDRDRRAFSVIGQWESSNGEWLATAEYLRAEADQILDEYSILALVNDDALFPIEAAGQSWAFDNGIFRSGTLTQAGGIPTEMLRFQREDDAKTEDYSFDLKWTPSDRISVNFEAQHVTSDRNEDGFIAAMSTYSDIFIDMGGSTPDVSFGPVNGATANQFVDSGENFYWFAIDNQVRNTGKMTSLRADIDYDLEDKFGIIKGVRFGARWSDRSRATKNTNFSNWGALSQPWTGGEVYANDSRGAISSYSGVRSPFEEFQRGNVSVPVPGGSAFFFGGDNLVQDYLSGAIEAQSIEIYEANLADATAAGTWNPAWGRIPNAWGPIATRGGLVAGTVYRDGEISDVDERTTAFYGRVDFGAENFLSGGRTLEGNFGLRYVETSVTSVGSLQFPVLPPAQGNEPAITRDNVVAVLCGRPSTAPNGLPPAVCSLSPERQALWAQAYTGEAIDDSADIKFNHWLPSFNAKLHMTDELLFRVAISKGISRPDLSLFRTNGGLGDNTNSLRQGGTLATGALWRVDTGNRLIRPVESWNFDVSAEWYFAEVGSLTASAFRKEMSGLINTGPTLRDITSDSGVTVLTEVVGPANTQDGSLYGFEFAYQQSYDFLPGLLSGLGIQATYTYVNAEDLSNSTFGASRSALGDNLALVGVSKNTINLTGFYEKGKISARLAYNWRSNYAITPRDVIFPYSPIIGESTGQLDGSFFYSLTDRIKLGVQAVNLLDAVTKTSQIIDFDGTSIPRSAFRNDRRFSFLARFEF